MAAACGGAEVPSTQPPSAYPAAYASSPSLAQPAPPPAPPELAGCAGTPLGTYSAIGERDAQNRTQCRNEPPTVPLVLSVGQAGELALRPENAPATVFCTTS